MIHVRTLGTLTALTLVLGIAAAQTNPLAPASAPAPYVETFSGTDPAVVFGGVLSIGADAPWTGALTGSAYELRNATDGGAVRFHYLTSLPDASGPLSQGAVSVEVVVRSGANDDVAGAGLILDYQEATRDYFAFVVTARGYALYRRDAQGLRALVAEASDLVRAGAAHRLTARTTDGQVDLFIDDTFVLGLESGGPLDGGIGIVAIGAGTFEYRTFVRQVP